MSDGPPKKKLIIKKKTSGGVKKIAKKSTKKKVTAIRPKNKAPAPDRPTEIIEAPPKTTAKSTEASAPGSETPAKAAPPPEPAPKEELVFHCPYCAKPNSVSHSKVGQQVSCASCGNTVTVPPPLAAPPAPADAKAASRPMFKFFCSVCGQKLSAPAEVAGATTVCPRCNSSITVPQNQPAPPESSGRGKASEDTFKFHCQNCGKRFEARRSWVGRPFQCPACQAENTVPDPDEQ